MEGGTAPAREHMQGQVLYLPQAHHKLKPNCAFLLYISINLHLSTKCSDEQLLLVQS